MIRIKKILSGSLLLIVTMANYNCSRESSATKKDFDIVILNGRVIDPESNLNAVRNIGIREGKVQLITEKKITGKTVIDAQDLVVVPGFIDIHQHGQDQENYRYKVMDGVTTALELELGTSDVDKWYSDRKDKTIINHGVSIGHIPLRMAVMHDPGGVTPVADAAYKEAASEEVELLKKGIEKGLNRGALVSGLA